MNTKGSAQVTLYAKGTLLAVGRGKKEARVQSTDMIDDLSKDRREWEVD